MKNLFKALAAFQQEAPVIHKGTKGYGYSYADLPAIFEVINPLLKKHGLGFTQLINTNEEKHYLVTVLFHVETGEQIQSSTLIPEVELKGMNLYQSFGAGCSYFRRYSLSSCLGLVTDIDTDAAGEQVKKRKPKITKERFNKALEAVKAGSYPMSELIEKFDLDTEQMKVIKKA
jgi:hypothetical protein